MPRRLFVFDPPERFIAGTVGPAGQRTFYLQARSGSRIVSVSLEKVQVAVLAERLDALLDELDRRGVAAMQPAGATGEDSAPLDEPLNEVFRAGTLTLGWDGDDDVIVVEARDAATTDEDEDEDEEEHEDVADDDPEGPDLLRVRIPAIQARAFALRAARVVGAGRPPCPLCGQPLDPQGHLCPRRNGTYLN
ncbi:MAG TPA: DUF3090 family protein [Candidatus Dormibacteraeota bacterium]|nr:DUF3090 family protein [Candidatus Dormibacteraeota bacterium]